MSTSKKSTSKSKANRAAQTEDTASVSDTKSLYADFDIWTASVKPKWHPVKKMRYVFFRMIDGCTITDAIQEIKWAGSEFWYLIDKKENEVFYLEYKRAKALQGRAIADNVMAIAEGRDVITKKQMSKMKTLVKKALRRAGKQKSPLAVRAIIEKLANDLAMNDSSIIARNRLQIDASKWMAKAANPNEFGEKSSVAVTGAPSGDNGEAKPIAVQFIAPDGSVMNPIDAIKQTSRPTEEST